MRRALVILAAVAISTPAMAEWRRWEPWQPMAVAEAQELVRHAGGDPADVVAAGEIGGRLYVAVAPSPEPEAWRARDYRGGRLVGEAPGLLVKDGGRVGARTERGRIRRLP